MTTREMLASVEAQIRKDIPRLMELREGCVLLNKSNKDKFEIIDIDTDFYEYVCLKNKKHITSIAFKNINLFEIIGHDIMLNDVLEWFRFMNSEGEEPFCYFTIDTNGNIIFDKFDEKTMSLYWDLSSPCLKDQREELIKFSYNIAKDE